MADSNTQPGDDRGKSAATSGRARKTRRGPRREQVNQLPRHLSRVFAMQALFEDDLTHHGLDDILQHFGEHKRRDLVESFQRLRGGSRKVVETIGFLARNADRDATGSGLTLFEESSEKAIQGLAQEIEIPDGDLQDEYLALRQERAQAAVTGLLEEFRTKAANYLRQFVDAPVRRPASHDDLDDDAPTDPVLADVQASVSRRLTETLATEERESISTLMDILQRTGILARGVQERLAEVDPHIERAAPAFPISHLASIDRAVLRIAVYELLHTPEVPRKAAVNEAVEIAKRYGGPNSGRFVNGVLRTITERLPEPSAG